MKEEVRIEKQDTAEKSSVHVPCLHCAFDQHCITERRYSKHTPDTVPERLVRAQFPQKNGVNLGTEPLYQVFLEDHEYCAIVSRLLYGSPLRGASAVGHPWATAGPLVY